MKNDEIKMKISPPNDSKMIFNKKLKKMKEIKKLQGKWIRWYFKSTNHQKALVILQNTIDIFYMIKII